MKFNWKFLLFSLLGTALRIIPIAVVPDHDDQPVTQGSDWIIPSVPELHANPLLAIKREYFRQ